MKIVEQNDMIVPHDHYISEKGKISLIYPCKYTFQFYEIFCCEGNHFIDVERFDTLEEAETRIKEFLI